MVVYIPWDVEDYYLECIKGKKDPKRLRFPNPYFGAFSVPLTVVDSRGRIVLWYIPGLLSREHQVSLCVPPHFKLPELFPSVKCAECDDKHWSLAQRVLESRHRYNMSKLANTPGPFCEGKLPTKLPAGRHQFFGRLVWAGSRCKFQILFLQSRTNSESFLH